jgi:hypothetical protein
MASPGEIPSVGDLVWVRTSSTEEELATVLNVDCEFDEDNTVDAPRISRNGILVEFNATQYQTVQDQNCLRPYTASPDKTRRQRQIITPSPTELIVDFEDKKTRAKRKRTTTEEKHPAKKQNGGSQEVTESPNFAKKAARKKPVADREDKKPPNKKEMQDKSIAVQGSAPDRNFKVENVSTLDSEGDSSDSGYSSGEETDDDRPFKVDYASTGRATCKRCDELIAKGTLRVSHVPLFRGKVSRK